MAKISLCPTGLLGRSCRNQPLPIAARRGIFGSSPELRVPGCREGASANGGERMRRPREPNDRREQHIRGAYPRLQPLGARFQKSRCRAISSSSSSGKGPCTWICFWPEPSTVRESSCKVGLAALSPVSASSVSSDAP